MALGLVIALRRLSIGGLAPMRKGYRHRLEVWASDREQGVVMTDSELMALRRRAEGGDRDAVDGLIELASERGDLDELRRLADSGNATAADELIELASEREDLDELRRLADSGNPTAAAQLAELAAE